MNAHVPQSTDNQIGNYLLAEIARVAEARPYLAAAVCDCALEQLAPNWPEAAPFFEAAKQEAEWWAEMAADHQAVEMLGACLKRVTTQRVVAVGARKRALVALWNSLDAADKAAFLEMVDPGGKGVGQ